MGGNRPKERQVDEQDQDPIQDKMSYFIRKGNAIKNSEYPEVACIRQEDDQKYEEGEQNRQPLHFLALLQELEQLVNRVPTTCDQESKVDDRSKVGKIPKQDRATIFLHQPHSEEDQGKRRQGIAKRDET